LGPISQPQFFRMPGGNLGPEAKAKIIEKLVHRVELLPDRLLIHFYVGQSLLLGELLSKEGSSPFFLPKFGKGSRAKQKSLNQVLALQRKSQQVSSSNTIDYGEPGMTRTCDLLLRRQLLYPTELRVRDLGWTQSSIRRGPQQGSESVGEGSL
jgi:hypothetical protein